MVRCSCRRIDVSLGTSNVHTGVPDGAGSAGHADRRGPTSPPRHTAPLRECRQRHLRDVGRAATPAQDDIVSTGDLSRPRQQRQVCSSTSWSFQQLQATMDAVEDGAALKTAARFYGIPPSTLSDWISGRSLTGKRGPPSVLSTEEENALEDYMVQMADYGHPLSMEQLRLKVALLTQERPTPFTNGIPGPAWARWFKKRHPNLALRQSQGLDVARAKGLCPTNVSTFYANLQELYEKHDYPPERIWNCDESGAQAGRNGGGRVWAKRGSRSVHSVIPNEHEWLTVLTCINAAGESVPGFYIFKGKRIKRNYIIHCEDGATMAMQPEAWMTQFLFSNWITHFINCLSTRGGVSHERRHLLIVDGHNSHVTLEVVVKAMDAGLDLLTLPSHTSHRLQPLDASIFALFKKSFKRYRDAWVMKNRGRGACKEVLAMWVSLGLQRALTKSNIQAGFCATGIWPINESEVEKYLGPAHPFQRAQSEGLGDGSDVDVRQETLEPTLVGERHEQEGSDSHGDHISLSQVQRTIRDGDGSPTTFPTVDVNAADNEADSALDALLQGRLPDPDPTRQHFVMRDPENDCRAQSTGSSSSESKGDDRGTSSSPGTGTVEVRSSAAQPSTGSSAAGLNALLELPSLPRTSRRTCRSREALVDYSKSILLTSEEYVHTMEVKAKRKEEALVEAARRREEASRRRSAREMEK